MCCNILYIHMCVIYAICAVIYYLLLNDLPGVTSTRSGSLPELGRDLELLTSSPQAVASVTMRSIANQRIAKCLDRKMKNMQSCLEILNVKTKRLKNRPVRSILVRRGNNYQTYYICPPSLTFKVAFYIGCPRNRIQLQHTAHFMRFAIFRSR